MPLWQRFNSVGAQDSRAKYVYIIEKMKFDGMEEDYYEE